MARHQPLVEGDAGGRLTERCDTRRIETQAVRLGQQAPRQRRAVQGCRPTQRANAMTSLAGGMAASSP